MAFSMPKFTPAMTDGSKVCFEASTSASHCAAAGVNAGTSISSMWTEVGIKDDNEKFKQVEMIKIDGT